MLRKELLALGLPKFLVLPSLALRIRDPGDLDHEVHDVFFEVGAGHRRLVGQEVEGVLGVLSKENAVAFAAGFPQILSPEIRLIDLRAKDQAAKAST